MILSVVGGLLSALFVVAQLSDDIPQHDSYPSPDGVHVAHIEDGVLTILHSDDGVLYTRDLTVDEYRPVENLPTEESLLARSRDFMGVGGLRGAWTPSGTRFLWTEMTSGRETSEGDWINGDGTIGYYNVETDTPTLVDNTTGIPFNWTWSPDEQYLLYQNVSSFYDGSPSGAGMYIVYEDGNWAFVDPGQSRTKGFPLIEGWRWLQDGTYLFTHFSQDMFHATGLFQFDPVTQMTYALYCPDEIGLFDAVDFAVSSFDEETQVVRLVTIDYWNHETNRPVYGYVFEGRLENHELINIYPSEDGWDQYGC